MKTPRHVTIGVSETFGVHIIHAPAFARAMAQQDTGQERGKPSTQLVLPLYSSRLIRRGSASQWPINLKKGGQNGGVWPMSWGRPHG